MRKKIVAGNWKMNGRKASVIALLNEITQFLPEETLAEVVVFPPSLYLPMVSDFLAKKFLQFGAQNVYPMAAGAFTGEISAPMLNDFNCRYVLVGHSERRHLFKEDEKIIAEKFHHVKEHDMIPVLCVGETLQEREQGLTEAVLARQIRSVAEYGSEVYANCVIAYEPVWAIGTGLSASPLQAQEAHGLIRALVGEASKDHSSKVTLLYGGSVNENNAKAIFSMPDVDGGLIGGASLNARQFVEIVKCIK